ncbi:hypothetical protein TIFTF001_041429 [Ficus carica]|uniref:Uncharacterized protein n=1 Tax=Ficus carica TaxID=3494 RepID=A0AA88CQ23_FICCA|nr:hypothetical protein TIFTF001_041429 [Ficus carica]
MRVGVAVSPNMSPIGGEAGEKIGAKNRVVFGKGEGVVEVVELVVVGGEEEEEEGVVRELVARSPDLRRRRRK